MCIYWKKAFIETTSLSYTVKSLAEQFYKVIVDSDYYYCLVGLMTIFIWQKSDKKTEQWLVKVKLSTNMNEQNELI